MVFRAWESVSSKSIIVKSWKKLWPGAEAVTEPNQSPQTRSEVQGLLTDLGREQDAVAEWLDGETDHTCSCQSVVSHDVACRALEALLQYADQQDTPVTKTVLLHLLHSQASRKRRSTLRQKVSNYMYFSK